MSKTRTPTPPRVPAAVRVFALTAVAVPLIAFAQQGGPGGMAAQMAEIGGMMHATAKTCGGYSEQELATMKQQQKAVHLQRGLDAASFEQAFARAETKIAQRWATMSAAQRDQACADIREQIAATAAAAR
ncbi:hypothetical protein FKV24_018370 [Lysobacter maris]|uniref:Uncharacterized protein n=1 Tax=Marilutibacter maris TaxID=1605891 RepID=A0A507ZUV4_9GAMM|nr:hypothetical protein [Lysobacter maris]KAB8162458.1 hypothetical protein FKV24_018370 [Lysobacter maris]